MSMLKNIWLVNIREFKKLWLNKKALLILFFVPILYTLLFGYMYSQQTVRDINTAVINYSPSQLSRTVIDGFDKSEKFAVKYNLQSEDEATPLLETGKVDVVLILPKDFTKNIKKGQNSNILLGVNASNSIIGNSAAGSAVQIAGTYSAGIKVQKFQAKGQLDEQAYNSAVPITISFRPWYNPSYNYTNYLLLGIISVALQQILLMSVANSFARETQEDELKRLVTESHSVFVVILGKLLIYFLAGITSLLGASFLAFKIFSIPLKGSFLYVLMLGLPFYISILALGVIISVFTKDQTEATQIAMLFTYPTFLLTGFTWPLIAIPDILKMISYSIPLTFFVENFRKIALMGISFDVLKADFYHLCVLAGVYLLVAVIAFQFKVAKPKFAELGKKVKQC